jgi:hypothetical protein
MDYLKRISTVGIGSFISVDNTHFKVMSVIREYNYVVLNLLNIETLRIINNARFPETKIVTILRPIKFEYTITKCLPDFYIDPRLKNVINRYLDDGETIRITVYEYIEIYSEIVDFVIVR